MAKNKDTIDLSGIKSLRQLVAERLQIMIYTGELIPGQRLVQTDLSERFGVSRVAIRDALQELRNRGLAVDVPLGGMIVRPVDEKDIRNIAAMRRLLEPYAAGDACRNMDDEGIEILRSVIAEQETLKERGDYLDFIRTDWDFHKNLFTYADNEMMLEFIESLWLRSRQARGLVLIDHYWGDVWSHNSIEGHIRMIRLLEKRDAEGLKNIILTLVDNSEKEQLDWIQNLKKKEI
jgi:DNA-binding GntR family transcriptional regulator